MRGVFTMATQKAVSNKVTKKDRLSIVENKIFGKYVNTKEGLITDFSPNNIRSLVFGVKSFMVVYHVKNKKDGQSKLCSIYDYAEGVQTDISKKFLNINSVRSVIKILNSVRKLSMLEEIIFLRGDMTTEDLVNAVDISYCGKESATIRNEFKRLHGIYTVQSNCTLVDIENRFIPKLTYFEGLAESLKALGLVNHLRGNINKNWYLEINLTPQFYAQDKPEGLVGSYFDDLKKCAEDRIKKLALKKKEEIKLIEIRKKYNDSLLKNYELCNKLYKGMTNLYNIKEPYSKAHWAYPCKAEFIATCIGNRIENESTLRDCYKAINWSMLIDKFKDKNEEDKPKLELTLFNIKKNILKPLVDSQVLSKEKTGILGEEKLVYLENWLKTINTILEKIIEVMVYLVYYSYLQYCMQAGHICVAQEYLDYLGEGHKLQTIEYHKEIPRVLNIVLPAKNNENMDAFSSVFKLSSKVESITLNVAYANAIKMLEGLNNKDAI